MIGGYDGFYGRKLIERTYQVDPPGYQVGRMGHPALVFGMRDIVILLLIWKGERMESLG